MYWVEVEIEFAAQKGGHSVKTAREFLEKRHVGLRQRAETDEAEAEAEARREATEKLEKKKDKSGRVAECDREGV